MKLLYIFAVIALLLPVCLTINNDLDEILRNLIPEGFKLFPSSVSTEMQDMINAFGKLSSTKERDCMYSNNCPKKRKIIDIMTNSTSDFRVNFGKFVRKYFSNTFGGDSNVIEHIINRHKSMISDNTYCDNTQSAHRVALNFIENLLKDVVITYETIVAAYRRNFYDETFEDNTEDEFSEEFKELSNLVGNLIDDMFRDVILMERAIEMILDNTSKEIHRCDPQVPTKGVTYDRLTNFFEPRLFLKAVTDGVTYDDSINFIEPRLSLEAVTDVQSEGDCFSNFKNYSDTKNLVNMELYSNMEENMSKDYSVEGVYCNSSAQITQIWIDKSNPDRMYYHFKNHAENEFFFNPKNSINNIIESSNGHNLEHINFDSSECHIGYCIFDNKNSTKSVRRISLDSVSASPEYVVTGIRWVIKNQIVHLQIQEGEHRYGVINKESVRWVEVSENQTNIQTLDKNYRRINFNDVILPQGYLVTGVKIENATSGLYLQVTGTRIGEFKQKTDEKITISGKRSVRTQIQFNDDYPPEFTPYGTRSLVKSESGKHFVNFGPSSVEKDAAQSTIPYFDTQEVVTDPPEGINGIGIYLRGVEGYSGYVAPRIFSQDMLFNIIDRFSMSTLNEFKKEFAKKFRKFSMKD